MDAELREVKQVIRRGLAEKEDYPDANLVRLLDDARAGKVPWACPNSCLVAHSQVEFVLEPFENIPRRIVEMSNAYYSLGLFVSSYNMGNAWRDALRQR